MSVAVCRSPAAFGFESILALTTTPTTTTTWLQTQQQLLGLPADTPNSESKPLNQEAGKPLGDIWSSIQAQKQKQKQEEAAVKEEEQPYVHPLMRRSSSLLSQKSLEVCTESLGSETGSEDFLTDLFSEAAAAAAEQPSKQQAKRARTEAAATVNYHCPASRRSSPPRSFPPPLPSISRRDGPCLQMRPVRKDGRLVVEAVPVPSQTYLQAERQGGRLLLSFISTSNSSSNTNEEPKDDTQIPVRVQAEQNEEEELMEAEEDQQGEEEDEVEVVDRGTVVEVKVSTQPQQNGSGAATVKVHRSSIVINKFVSISDDYRLTATAAQAHESERPPPLSPVRRLSTTATTTAAAAAVAASSLSTSAATDGSHSSAADNRLLFTSRRRNKDELLHDMMRCSQLRQTIFFSEPCCIATSS